jgi:hypothetical protein
MPIGALTSAAPATVVQVIHDDAACQPRDAAAKHTRNEPINPKLCNFMLPKNVCDYEDEDTGGRCGTLYVMSATSDARCLPRKWKLQTVDSRFDSDPDDVYGTLAPGGTPGTRVVGQLYVQPRPPILYVHSFTICEDLRGLGYGTAFAKRLNTLLTRKGYGFMGCESVALRGLDYDSFLFFEKAAGIGLFMESAATHLALFGADLTEEYDYEPYDRELLWAFWKDKCGHDDQVVEVLVAEWGEWVKLAHRSVAAKRAAGS